MKNHKKRIKHISNLCKNCRNKSIGKMHHLYCNKCWIGIHGTKKERHKDKYIGKKVIQQ